MTAEPLLARWRRALTHALGLRLAVWYAAVFLISVASVGLLAYWLLVLSLERRDHDLLQVKLAEYAEHYEAGGLVNVSRAVAAERASGSPDSVLVRLVGPNADVLLTSMPEAWGAFDVDRLDPRGRADAPRNDDWQLVPSVTRETTLEVVGKLLPDGVVIQVGRTTLGRDQFLSEVRHLLGFILVAVLAAGLAGGMALTQSALRPLRELRNTVRGVARTGRLDTRVVTDLEGDLVDELGQTFNAMLGRIETLVDGMRGALDNVAHDLRTPIARLRARAESALTSASTEAECRDALAACVEEADQVVALLTTLMDISEAETGTMRLALEAVPVDHILRDSVDLYEDAADDRGVTLSATPAEGLFVRADRQRLRQVMANLVDNAVKHTPRDGRITVSASQQGSVVTLRVEDTGTGIAPDDLPRIWDRLYRGAHEDDARGLGLGLSLVRAIVTAHGGRADVQSEPGKGSVFLVSLPAADASDLPLVLPSEPRRG